MTPNNDEPRLGRAQAPDHGASFWGDLEASLTAETRVIETVATNETATLPTEETGGRTAELPKVAVLADRARDASPGSRRLWPLGIAALLLAVVGLGVLVTQRPTDPATTAEIVAGPTEDGQLVPLDGPSGDGEDSADSGTDQDQQPVDEKEPDAATAGEPAVATAPSADTNTPDEGEPASVPALTVTRIFDAARGATGEPGYLPFDDSLSDDATFLANWEARALTWYADRDAEQNCVDQAVSEIFYVNGSGLVQEVRDPQLSFTGEISHFTLHPEDNIAAWVVSCADQLELYTGTLDDAGRVEHLDLIWFGEGSVRAALLLWDGPEINLNAIEPGGRRFAIAYDTQNDVITRDGDPTRAALEAGSPVRRDATPLAATADGGVSYWVGQAPADIFSACPEIYGSDLTDTIWLRQGDGNWQPSLVDETPLGRITALALEPTFSQIAFADVCDGQTQRLFLGTVRADGRISNLREISLTPYVPGFASELFWIDAQTLRIEIDNSEFGAAPNRMDFRFDDGRQEGIIVKLD